MPPAPTSPLDRLAGLLDLDPEDVLSLDTRLDDDLELDSLDRAGLCLAIEGEFGVAIPDETAEGWQTVGDIIDTLVSLSQRSV